MEKKIDKKIPIPEFRTRSIHHDTISKMKVSDSVFFDNPIEANRFYSCCIQSFRDWKFTRRTLTNGTRICRI
jgi:hypothetical protein